MASCSNKLIHCASYLMETANSVLSTLAKCRQSLARICNMKCGSVCDMCVVGRDSILLCVHRQIRLTFMSNGDGTVDHSKLLNSR